MADFIKGFDSSMYLTMIFQENLLKKIMSNTKYFSNIDMHEKHLLKVNESCYLDPIDLCLT